jgi:hypothetical protein
MESLEAREHLEIVDRILAQSDRSVCLGSDIFLVWGLASGLLDLVIQLVLTGKLGGSWTFLSFAALGFAIVYSIVRGRAMAKASDRKTTMQREYFNVLMLAIGVTAVAQIGAYGMFSGWASAGLWTMAAAIVTFYVGMHGNRRGIVGGIILLASLVAASFVPAYTGYMLAAGMFFGYAGFGLASMLARD